MFSEGSVTHWLNLLKQGDSQAVQVLWERYKDYIVHRADEKLGPTPRRAADEEDVALAAFASFCRGVEFGRFPQLDNRVHLRQVLLMLIDRKAVDQIRRENALIRGGGRVRGDSGLAKRDRGRLKQRGFDHVVGPEITPESAALLAERFVGLLEDLNDPELERVALDRMAGYANREIAQRLCISLRGVARRLALIRRIWSQEC